VLMVAVGWVWAFMRSIALWWQMLGGYIIRDEG
jgi:hypothetical protein